MIPGVRPELAAVALVIERSGRRPVAPPRHGFRFRVEADGTASVPHVSDECADLLGCTPREAMSDAERLRCAVHLADRDDYDAAWARSLRTLRPVRWVGRVVGRDDCPRLVMVTAQGLRLPDGATEWHATVAEHSEDRPPDPEEKVHRPADALATLGHDVGEPLAALLLCAELAHEEMERASRHRSFTVDEDAVRACLRAVVRQAHHLAEVRDDLLAVADDADTLDSPTPVADVLAHLDAVADLVPDSLRVTVRCDPRLSCAVQPSHLAQMLSGLVSNAVRFAQHQVTLSASAVGARVVISVHDDGRGVAPEAAERLFRRFVRLDAPSPRPGAGLGLCVVRTLASANNGTVHHTPGGPGATFTLTLPRSEARVPVEVGSPC